MGARDAGLSEHAPYGAVMHVQLPRERTDGPAFGVMQSQDLRLELARDHPGTLGSVPPDSCAPGPSAQPRPQRQWRATERATTRRLGSGSTGVGSCSAVRIARFALTWRTGRYAARGGSACTSLMRPLSAAGAPARLAAGRHGNTRLGACAD